MSILRSDDLLAGLAAGFPRLVELSLRPAYFDLLRALGDPHEHLPPVVHVAGTNGKGSACAFLRAILESAGKRVHVYTSPHLVRFHERIRLAGKLIDETALVTLLRQVEGLIAPGSISQFEAATAAAFKAFADTPADYLILETGLGGRYDATNVVARPLAGVITRISYDHREYLGDTLTKIAGEKAGIIKPDTPCFLDRQAAPDIEPVIRAEAETRQAPLYRHGRDWRLTPIDRRGFRYADRHGEMDLPLPALLGAHQIGNAGLAIATLRHVLPAPLPPEIYAQGLRQVEWPARLQRLDKGWLASLLPPRWELWLDGGHNDSAGEVLAAQAQAWNAEDRLPLYVIYGMLKSKAPREFLRPLAPHVAALRAVTIPDEPNTLPLAEALQAALDCGIAAAAPAPDIRAALQELTNSPPQPGRILICGSLYLAGHVLRENTAA